MRKHRKSLAIFLFIVVIVGISRYNTPERKVIRYYNAHIDELKENIAEYEAGDPLAFPPDINVQMFPGEYSIIQYTVMGRGIVPASVYYGFFYSEDNVPVPYQNSRDRLEYISDTEWKWKGAGDNHGYIRQIEPNWFYFEAAF